jgi:hypothetical protein
MLPFTSEQYNPEKGHCKMVRGVRARKTKTRSTPYPEVDIMLELNIIAGTYTFYILLDQVRGYPIGYSKINQRAEYH